MYLLLISGILGLFVNMLTTYDKHSFCNSENLRQALQMQLSKQKKLFLNFFVHFWTLHQILKILKKKMTLIANVYPQLLAAKEVVR